MVFVRPSSESTNFTVCDPGLTDTWTRGVLPSDRPSRKHVDGGIELMLRNPSPPSAAAAAGAAAATGAGAGAGAGAGGGEYATAGAPPVLGSSVTVSVFSAWPSSKLIGCLKSSDPDLLASSAQFFAVSMSTEMGSIGSSRRSDPLTRYTRAPGVPGLIVALPFSTLSVTDPRSTDWSFSTVTCFSSGWYRSDPAMR